MIKINELYWLAGYLEGEGCFHSTVRNSKYLEIYISVSNSDIDMLHRAYTILRCPGQICEHISKFRDGHTRRKHYRFSISGRLAFQWMLTLYSLMGERRKAKIKEIVEAYKIYNK